MTDPTRRQAAAIVREAWPDEAAIAGQPILDRIAEDDAAFERPREGDHLDLGGIFELLKVALETVSAAIAVYQAVRAVRTEQEAKQAAQDSLEAERADGLLLSDAQISLIVRQVAALEQRG